MAKQRSAMESAWQEELRPALIAHAPASTEVTEDLISTTERYVVEVDELVSMLEHRSEARVDLLHLIQIISLVFSILIIFGLFLDIKKRVLGLCCA